MSALAIGSFVRQADFVEALARARRTGRRVEGRWSPFPVAAPDDAPTRGIGIATVGALAGILGAGLFYLLEWWTAVIAYPFNAGGRALHSWPAFLVAPIEIGALSAGAAGLVAFLMRGRLTRLHDSAFAIDEIERASRDRFVLALRCEEGIDARSALALLAGAGAVETRLVTP
jgi:hypothetical protein